MKLAIRAMSGVLGLALAGLGCAQSSVGGGAWWPAESQMKAVSIADGSLWRDEGTSAHDEPSNALHKRVSAATLERYEWLKTGSSHAVLPGEKIGAVARAALVEVLARGHTEFQIVLLAPPRDIPLPSGRTALRVRPVAPLSKMANKLATVWVDIVSEDGLVRSVGVQFRVDEKKTAFSSQAVAARKEVAPAARFPVLKPRALADIDEAQSAENPAAIQDLPGTSTIPKGPVATAPEILRGGSVQLNLRTGSITLERAGIALANGRTGQFIPVRIPGVSTPLTGRVISARQVEVQI